MKTKMWEDPIVAEVRKVKERLAAKFDFDVVAMLRAQQKREKSHSTRLVSLESEGFTKNTTIKRHK